MLKEFKEFALKGNALDLAIGIIIGAAFGAIVNTLVNDVLMPPVGLVLGNLDFANLFIVLKEGTTNAGPYTTPEIAKAAGAVTLNYGRFINSIISFLIIAFSVFMLIKALNKFNRKRVPVTEDNAPITKDCPYCITRIPIQAIKCPSCTADLK